MAENCVGPTPHQSVKTVTTIPQPFFTLGRPKMAKPMTIFILLLLVAFLSIITPPTQSLCSDSIITSLSLSGFAHFAHALHSHNLSATRPTCFVAPDSAFLGRLVSPNTVRAHILPAGALPFKTLLQLPLNTALPTLHHNTSLIFGTDGKRVSFNDVLITAPNLHVDDSCIVHGVEGPLVPMPPLTDDEDDDLTRANIAVKSPQELPKPPRRRFAEVVRFIRRSHRPILGDQNQDTNLP